MSGRDEGVLSDEGALVASIISNRLGEVSAISVGALSVLTGIPDRRLRAIVKALVELHGFCFCSSPRGFYCPNGPDEVLSAARRLLSWSLSTMKRARVLRGSPELDRLYGQLELELKKIDGESE